MGAAPRYDNSEAFLDIQENGRSLVIYSSEMAIRMNLVAPGVYESEAGIRRDVAEGFRPSGSGQFLDHEYWQLTFDDNGRAAGNSIRLRYLLSQGNFTPNDADIDPADECDISEAAIILQLQ